MNYTLVDLKMKLETLNLHIMVRTVLIHRDLSNQSSLALLISLVSKNLAGTLVDCSKIAGSCGSTIECSSLEFVSQLTSYCQQSSSKTYNNFLINMFRKRLVFILRFHGERVAVEPIQQRFVQAQAYVRHLRSMNVCVDKSGY